MSHILTQWDGGAAVTPANPPHRRRKRPRRPSARPTRTRRVAGYWHTRAERGI